MEDRPRQFHLVVRFAAVYIGFAVMLSGIFAYAFFARFSSAAFDNLRAEAMSTAQAISESVDFSGHETLVRPDQEFIDPTYRRIFDDLLLATDANPQLTYVYTMRPQVDGAWVFVVDASLDEDINENGVIEVDEASADIGEAYDVSCCPNLPLGLNGPTADEDFASDQWGTWISGYAPIVNEDGTTSAIVGVDISIDEWVEARRSLLSLVAITLGITLLFTLLFGIIGVFIFTAESRRVKEALTIRNEDLEKQVKVRTDQLQEFMATIVHELRAPLTAMRWQLEELQTKRRSKEEREALTDMHNVTDTLLGLIGDFLIASKMTVGKFTVVKKKGNILTVINQSIQTFTPQARARGLSLTLEAPKRLPSLPIDASRLSQVMNNLLSNAIKYTQKGSVTVRVSKEDDSILVEVIDTGDGIDAKNLKLLFQPFVRIGDSQAQVGTGLGLAIAKGIVESHGGTIQATSKKGAGSTFSFKIPLTP